MTLSKPIIFAAIALAGLLLLVANGHLIYVALTSQPGCVAHDRTSDMTTGRFAAAKPSC